MFSKPRKSVSLQILDVLIKRKQLTAKEKATYKRLLNGYQGEKRFAALLKEKFHNSCILLFDLNLTVNGSECQLDCILILENDIFLLDVKNFQGDYFIKNESLFLVRNTKEVKNPLHQLKRAEIILTDFLIERQNSSFTIKPYLIFIHPDFHVYQAPHNLPIIYPGQLNRFIHGLHKFPYDIQTQHKNLANQLIDAHVTHSNYEQLPSYEYHQLKRGIVCRHCEFMMIVDSSYRRLICQKCQTKENAESAVMRNIAEFHLLFPNDRITVSAIDRWCNHIIPKSGIRRILSKGMKLIGYGRGSYYVKK